MANNIFEDLVPRDVPKAGKPTENMFADLIPEQEPQVSNIGAKGDQRPDNRPVTDVQGQFMRSAVPFVDELVAGMTTPVEMGINALTGEGPTDPYEAYQQVRAHQNAREAATLEQRPIASAAAGLGGAFLPAGAGLKLIKGGRGALTAATGGSGLVGKSIRGAGAGTAIGGIFGAGEGEGLEERAANASSGAQFGGIVGAAAPSAGKAIGQGVRLLKAVGRSMSAPVRSLANKETFAAQKVAEAAERDGMSMPRLERRLQTAQGIKSDAMLADVGGKNVSSLLRSAGNVPSEGREALTRGLAKRQDQQLNRLSTDIGSAFGDPKTFTSTVENVTLARKQNAKPLFDAAFQTGTPWTVPLQNVLQRPLMRQLVERARVASANRGEQFKSIFAQQLPNGTFKFSRVPATEYLHRIKMEIDSALNQLKKREETGLTNVNIRDLTILKQDFMKAIQNPTYKRALNQYAGDSSAVNALDEGFDEFIKLDPEEIAARLKAMPGHEGDLARLGFARRLVNGLRDSGRAGTNRAEILYSPKYLDRMRAAFKDTATGKDFMRKLNMERQMFRTKNAVEGNSTTAAQLAEGMESGVEAENIRQAADMGGKLMRGDIVGAMVSWIGRAKNAATGLRPEVADQIIRMLTSKDPTTVSRAQALVLREMNKLSRGRGAPQRVENLVTTMGLGSIPGLSPALSGGQ